MLPADAPWGTLQRRHGDARLKDSPARKIRAAGTPLPRAPSVRSFIRRARDRWVVECESAFFGARGVSRANRHYPSGTATGSRKRFCVYSGMPAITSTIAWLESGL